MINGRGDKRERQEREGERECLLPKVKKPEGRERVRVHGRERERG